ncbi:hypothetical protein EJ08DRAFT_474127 [Tothia fuscella]|uniref:Uncharacterized protein n=1 Tax=Tothia fuscella TaxID=1048955 RepID=A0A9P4NZR3_9PEZI|nr:hypothetical protein EJ08DRAFT_474127 [Tothia fuscella]
MEVASANFLVRSEASRLRSYISPSMPSQHQSSSTQNSHFSSLSQSTSLRSSDSTATGQSTLFPTPSNTSTAPAVNNGPVLANNNVLNQRADKDTSLFQICLNLRERLRGIPECNDALVQEEEDGAAHNEEPDPVTLIWRTFRQGEPLMAIYNALSPAILLRVGPEKKTKRDQAAAFAFLNACIKELKFEPQDCFFLTDLYGDDTTGFVKVTRVVNRVLDILVERGILAPEAGQIGAEAGGLGRAKTQREHIVDELVRTERTYVRHLELLQDFKKHVEEKNIISGDAVHYIFLNLNALLDFQRRFLIRVEQTNALPPEHQNWGNIFIVYRNGFDVYQPYIANTKKCEELALREFDKLRECGGPPELRQMVESPTVLSSFLLKPFQRLSKYPLLLKELRDKGDLDEDKKAEITEGIAVATAILQKANEAVHKEERIAAVNELRERVEDWKGHRLDSFGDLLLHGTHHVIKGGSNSGKEEEREYKIYLFQMILLCCKEMNGGKQKNQKKALIDKKGRPKLQLKGRIFMQNVTDTVCSSKPGHYTCQIFWKGDPGIEFFTIKFPAEDMMKRWYKAVDDQRRLWQQMQRDSAVARAAGVSSTEFQWTREHGSDIRNPYAEPEDDDDDSDATFQTNYNSEFAQSDYSLGRNGSSTSLNMRPRTNTGDSGPGRVAPPRFPMGAQAPALSVRTQNQDGQQRSATSPNEFIMDSYFSPTTESPVSTRSSGQLSSHVNMFPFPRQQVSHMQNGWNQDDNARFTAPAMPRQGSRDGPLNGYVGRMRPSLPLNPAASASNRLRSVSSPDINNGLGPRQAVNPAQPGVPDLPPFPAHYAYQANAGGLSRVQNDSPQSMNSAGVPLRSSTQSPGVQQQRDRMPPPRSIPLPVLGYQGGDPYGQPPLTRAITSIDRTMTPEIRSITPGSIDARMMTPVSTMSNRSPPMPSIPQHDIPIPTQLKVKVHCPSAGHSFMLVVPTSIQYTSLKDRIDAKLQRTTNLSLSTGAMKLKYLDEDDYVSIQSDEDVQMAFETWREQQKDDVQTGQLGEIELYVQ